MKTKHEKKIAQADRLMEDWAGRKADKSKIPGVKPKTGFWCRMKLAKSEPFKSNPEYALGCARLLMTYNIMTHKDLSWMLNNHPAWAQIIEFGTMDANGALMEEAKQSTWGQKHKVTATMELYGTATVTYEGRKGVKTEKVNLGLEMIRYEGDTRPFVALNLGGGSAIKHFLLKLEAERPDFTVNDDSNTRRFVSRRTLDEAKAEDEARVEKELDVRADDAVALLLAGESITMGLGATASKDEPRAGQPKRKSPSSYSANRGR